MKPKKGRQRAINYTGQPAARWPVFMGEAAARIGERRGWKLKTDPVLTIAAEIVRHGDGEKFLKAARRGRSTARQNLRFQLLREVERLIGASVPRRRDDTNTPDAVALLRPLRLELQSLDTMRGALVKHF